jgi:deoxyribodipyrimidine photo-lyase
MSRDQRVRDNWAFLFAVQLAKERNVPLAVAFTLSPSFLGATERQYGFMLGGLQKVESDLTGLGIPFYVLPGILSGDLPGDVPGDVPGDLNGDVPGDPPGAPPLALNGFVREYGVGTVVSDFDPLRIKMRWKKSFLEISGVEFYTVDAHNIVPAFHASDKQEFGAYTLRPKINRLLESFLVPYPEIETASDRLNNDNTFSILQTHWNVLLEDLDLNAGVPEVDWLVTGEKHARSLLDRFIHERLDSYASQKNDPNAEAVSNLSPYLHFGQISAQRVALEILKERRGDDNTAAFLEELIVRKELSDNYCLYNPDYDNLEGIPAWAGKTLNEHRRDEREHLYDPVALEAGKTHEDLWNAAQMEMVKSGKMHGYMRMYWAKKILEWTASPEKAMEIAVYLNDRYQLDGRDPNGYAGCAWAIAGVHDRPWGERPVFGKIRYMNEKGCRRKFDVDAYIRKWL